MEERERESRKERERVGERERDKVAKNGRVFRGKMKEKEKT